MDQETYRTEYLQSDHWKALRLRVLERDDHRCRVCYAKSRLDVHHRTYERVTREDLNDLTTLCRTCHDLYETAKRLAKNAKTAPAPRILIRLAAGLPPRIVDDLKELLSAHPGASEVALEIASSNGTSRRLELGDTLKIAPSPTLRAELERLLGPTDFHPSVMRARGRQKQNHKPGRGNSPQAQTAIDARKEACLRVITDNGPLTCREIAQIVPMTVGKTGAALSALRRDGKVRKAGKMWSIKRWPTM